jgi:hypothetical protein
MAAGPTYTPIATYPVVGSSTNTVSFNSFSGYTDLILQVNNQVGSASGFRINFNSDTSANYSFITLQGFSSVTSYKSTNATPPYGSAITNNLVYGDAINANFFTHNYIQIQNYSNSTTYKSLMWRYGTASGGFANPGEVALIVGTWRSTAPITSIQISIWNPTIFNAGTDFTLYGIKAA